MLRFKPCTKLLFRSYKLSSVRAFAAPQGQQQEVMGLDDLELQALSIQRAIDNAKENIEKNTQKGVALSRQISQEVEQDKYIKMQRYQIFITKME